MRRWLPAMLLVLSFSTKMPATTVLPMYLDDLTSQSQTVAYGTVVASRVEWDAAHRWIFTVYTIEPSQYLKGNLGSAFELREPGGERDGLLMVIAGVPHFDLGQQAVLFVWTDPQGHHQVTSLAQGAVTIQTDPTTSLQIASRSIPLGSARTAAAVISAQPSSSRALPQLLDQIRVSVAKSSQNRSGE
jgi:hypothetical protein